MNLFLFSPLSNSVVDEFQLRCQDWKNQNLPIHFNFYYELEQHVTDDSLKILNPGTSELPHVKTLIPLGLKDRDYNVTIVFRISNEYGQYAEIKIEVQVFS